MKEMKIKKQVIIASYILVMLVSGFIGYQYHAYRIERDARYLLNTAMNDLMQNAQKQTEKFFADDPTPKKTQST